MFDTNIIDISIKISKWNVNFFKIYIQNIRHSWADYDFVVCLGREKIGANPLFSS